MYTKHHILPSSRWGSNVNENLVRLPENLHVNLHRLFWNKTPVEQVEMILSISEPALKNEWKRTIREVLHVEKEYVYRYWVLVPNFIKNENR